MSDDYLWDRSGEPDPMVARLETKLASFRYRPAPRFSWRGAPRIVRAAAVLLVVVLGGALAWRVAGGGRPAGGDAGRSGAGDSATVAEASPYEIEVLSGGAVLVAGGAGPLLLAPGARGRRLSVGSRIESRDGARLSIAYGDLVRVLVQDAAVLSLERVADDEHRLALASGRVSVNVAPPPLVAPRLVRFDTPAGLVVDLGCRYELQVADDGAAEIEVTLGCVAFEAATGTVYVPRGHRLRTVRGNGFGLPVAVYTTDEVKVAARSFDEAPSAGVRHEALLRLLSLATSSDRVPLWHLVATLGSREDRTAVLARIESFHAFGKGFDRTAVLDRDPGALAELRKELIGW